VLFKVYKMQNPRVEIINATVAGGAGFAARPVLQTRLADGKPPDIWQTHPGQELLDQYVGPGYCEAITELYKSEAFRRSWWWICTKDLKIYAVLVGIPRGNILWYVADAGANPTFAAGAIQSAPRSACLKGIAVN
jgi:glucose/mannose transport system substrate-binding protein